MQDSKNSGKGKASAADPLQHRAVNHGGYPMYRKILPSLLAIAACWPALSAEVSTSRISFSPAVQAIVNSASPEGDLARAWVRFSQALIGEAGIRLEDVVSAEVRCLELEAAGYPRGLAGLQQFRKEINAAMPDETVFVAEMRFTGPGVIETELHAMGTHSGEFLGRKPTGQRLWFLLRTLNRFENGRMVMRWDRADFGPALREIDAALARKKP
jgi:predicted ester cyclase